MLDLKYLPNVTTLILDVEKCSGCLMCTIVCPHCVFAMEDKKATIIDRDACMECGACAQNCPEDAINVRAGVGCAEAAIVGAIRGTEPSCDCSDDSSCC